MAEITSGNPITKCDKCGHNVDGHDPENGCLQGWMSPTDPGRGIRFCGCKAVAA